MDGLTYVIDQLGLTLQATQAELASTRQLCDSLQAQLAEQHAANRAAREEGAPDAPAT